MSVSTPIPYHDDVETESPDEKAVIDETVARMRHLMEESFEQHRHATSGTHAKTHGVVTGELQVLDGLPAELAQGLFGAPGAYEVVVRYASEPGTLEPDTEQRARGFALKVLGVPGEMLHNGWTSQDFLFNTWPVIPQGDAASFLNLIRQRDQGPGAASGPSPRPLTSADLLFDRTPNTHPLAYTFYSQGAFRYGDHVAKFAVAPVAAEQLALADRTVAADEPPGVLKDWVQAYYAQHGATYEFRVQLLTDVDTMPIEDASVEWPQDASPYRTVATLHLPHQETFSAARRTYAEDVMSWRPWYGLAAHRPLGSINRLRRRGYTELGAQRHQMNAVAERNPTGLGDVPA